MGRGKHIIVDCKNVPDETCWDDKKMLEVMARAATRAGANVINTSRYHFGHNSCPGFTTFLLLDESHVSAHGYFHLIEKDGNGNDKEPKNLLALDAFSCGKTSPYDILKYIQEEIDLGDITIRELDRFVE